MVRGFGGVDVGVVSGRRLSFMCRGFYVVVVTAFLRGCYVVLGLIY